MSTTETMKPTVNGETPSYKSLDHLASYPIISDSISTFKTYPLGQRSIDITHSAYCTFIAPLSPYLSKAAPYVTRADELAETGLGKIEERFPIVKEPTESIKSTVVDTIGYPRRLVGEVYVRGSDLAKDTKEYVFSIYGDELARQDSLENKGGYIPRAKAGVTTGLVVSTELMTAIAAYLGNRKDQVKVEVDEIKK
ncbi:hypothetical protein Q9L58_004582 [Maublancomyces gigas]|uniref:Uncharacterized protein n=1 Tax=Discina gigas TaxID=1032678 RepID=A0ABR3GKH0_9PEZI